MAKPSIDKLRNRRSYNLKRSSTSDRAEWNGELAEASCEDRRERTTFAVTVAATSTEMKEKQMRVSDEMVRGIRARVERLTIPQRLAPVLLFIFIIKRVSSSSRRRRRESAR